MFHKQVVPVDATRHASLKLGPLNNFSFAAEIHAVPVVGPEFADMLRDYPIVFAQNNDQSFTPTVMLGMRQNENLYVTADGKWDAAYIPFFVRRYPFVTAEIENDDAVVCIDEEAADKLTAEDGMALFENGEATEPMKQFANLLFTSREEAKRAQLWCKLLAEADLFKQVGASADMPNGEKVSMDGMWVVDEDKLRTLPAEKLKAWMENGLLSLIYAHLFSLRNLQNLVERLTKKVNAA